MGGNVVSSRKNFSIGRMRKLIAVVLSYCTVPQKYVSGEVKEVKVMLRLSEVGSHLSIQKLSILGNKKKSARKKFVQLCRK